MRFVRDYAFREKCSLGLGFTFLLGANMAELGVPLYIGAVIDMFAKRDFDGATNLSAWMLLCIIVSAFQVSYYVRSLVLNSHLLHRFQEYA